MNTLMMASKKQLLYSSLLILTSVLLLFGYRIAHFFYNQYDFTGAAKINVAHNYWKLRHIFYSLIIFSSLYLSKQNLNRYNTCLANIGINLVSISIIDKIFFNDFVTKEYDYIIIVVIILLEYINYKYFSAFILKINVILQNIINKQ